MPKTETSITDLLAAAAAKVEAAREGHDISSTPPMFYPEMIACAVKAAYERGKSRKPLHEAPRG